MSTGRAQAITWSFPDEPNWKLGHFEAGTATPKTIWTDAAKTTPAASPAVADANGGLTLYGDGNYKFTFDSSVDVEIAPDADNYQLTADTAIQWEDDYGTSFPSATSTNEMQLFAKRDVTKTYLNLGVNLDGTSFESIVEKKVDGTFTLFDQPLPSVYVLNVKEYGATGDGSTDDTTAIQNAIDAVSATGDAVYFPRGIYKCVSSLTHLNDPITIFGDGMGLSVIKFTSAASNGFDFGFDDATDNLNMFNLSIQTEKAGGGDAINATWPNASLTRANCVLYNLDIGNTVATSSSAYWTNGIVLNNSRNAVIQNVWYVGESTNGRLSTAAISLTGACFRTHISKAQTYYTATSILEAGTSEESKISLCNIKETTTGIYLNFGATEKYHKVLDNHIEADDAGISLVNCVYSKTSGNTVIKPSGSTGDFIGIALDTSSDHCKVTGNSIRNAGSSGGTEDGIKIIDGDRVLIDDNIIEDMDGKAIWLDANATNCQVGVNIFDNAGTNYQDDGTGNYYLPEWVYGEIALTAAAATITLPGYGSSFIITNASGDIDTISSSWVGRTIVIRGDSGAGFTLKHETDNIHLTSDVDATFGTWDTMMLTFHDAKWIQSTDFQNH